ncbi:unnamed protein product [Nezara viridula]|uniref:Uncharacterized protein n=1 Tax=Nezara viridula TaxID=85310 RepID=A0A9P0HU08_NEZVI|nr:unnamed protein product [Nezara viridula]
MEPLRVLRTVCSLRLHPAFSCFTTMWNITFNPLTRRLYRSMKKDRKVPPYYWIRKTALNRTRESLQRRLLISTSLTPAPRFASLKTLQA